MMTMGNHLRPRWVAVLTYALYALAGTAFMLLPNGGIKELLGSIGFFMWNFLLSFGGIICLIGAARKNHWLELVGLPGVVTGLGVYSLYIGSRVFESDTPGIVIGFSAICGGAAVGAIGRAYEVRTLTKINSRVSEQIREEERGDNG